MSEKKAKSLFDHIRAVTSEQDPEYWSKISEDDRKSWSNFMIHRFLSMNPDWIETISQLQPYTEILQPEQLYLFYIGLLPKGRYYLKYVKGKNEEKYEKWLIELIKVDYNCSLTEARDYCEILYATKEGREHIKYICEKYGTEPKKISQLKLKLSKTEVKKTTETKKVLKVDKDGK